MWRVVEVSDCISTSIRICPGRHLGEGSLFLFIASVLHSFDIRSGKDEDGEPIEITDDVTTGLIA